MAPNKHLWLVLWLALASEVGADTTAHLRTTITDQYRITFWTSEQGLPQNTVTCLLQSRDGLLWIGTRYGLARYDGVRFTDFTPEMISHDETELDVRGLAEDTQGRLWLHTAGGLISYHEGRFERFSLTNTPFSGRVTEVCSCRTGGLWVLRQGGVFQFDAGRVGRSFGVGKEVTSPFPPDHAELGGLREDPEGKVWIRMTDQGYDPTWQQLDPATGLAHAMTNLAQKATQSDCAVYPDQAGRLWLARTGELQCWEGGRVTRFDASSAWGNNGVKTLAEDARGNIWVVSEGTVQVHRFSKGLFASYGRREGFLNTDDVRSLLPDREGNIWLGTGSGGLFRIQPRQLVSVLTGSASTVDEVYSIGVGKEGRVWLATTYGLVKYQAGDFTVYTNKHGLGAINTMRLRLAFESRSGEVFTSLDFEGLKALRDGVFCDAPCVEPLLGERRMVNSLCEDTAGTLWVASPRGLAERRGETWRLWTKEDGLSDNRVFGIVSAPNGSLWVGTQNAGVNEFRQGRFRVYTTREGLLSQSAWPLMAEPDGTVWVGTPVGLNRIRSNGVSSVTMRNGLFDSLAYCLLEDRRSNYWSFGNRGIWRMKKEELHAVADHRASRVHCVSYGEADGMPSAEGNGDEQPNAASLPNGELWFPTTRGVVVLNPEELRDNKVPPPVVIEEVRIDEDLVYKDGGFLEVNGLRKSRDGHLRLPPGRARVLEVRYTASTFIDSEKTVFRFRLQSGREVDAREKGTGRVAVFTNLRPGRYRFQVEACNSHGYWSKAPAEFNFDLAPYFYQTWPFIATCGLTVLSGMGVWHFRRLSMFRRVQRLRQAGALEAERGRIAKDLHDDLGANLTGLALQIEIASQELSQPAVLQRHLKGLAESIRGLVDRMREVVWSLNPQCDTLESFCAFLCQYAENFLAAAGLRCRLDLPEEVPTINLSADSRHNLLLVAKEALNNASKHSSATEVRLCLSLDADDLLMTIVDNGCGFRPDQDSALRARGTPTGTGRGTPANAASLGHGLGNMRRRVESLGGRFELFSHPGSGTRIATNPVTHESTNAQPGPCKWQRGLEHLNYAEYQSLHRRG